MPDMVGVNPCSMNFNSLLFFVGIFAKVAGIWCDGRKWGLQNIKNSLIIPVFSMGGAVECSNTASYNKNAQNGRFYYNLWIRKRGRNIHNAVVGFDNK